MPSDARDDAERFEPRSLSQWTDWLEANHETSTGVWFVSSKKATGRQACTYEESVIEALRVGWIDSNRRSLDAERSIIWFCPRRKGSPWAKPNKVRVARLEAEGRMLPSGRAVIERATADGSWSVFDDADALIVPDDLVVAFGRHPGAAEKFDELPASAKWAALSWIALAKRAETRAKRVDETARITAAGGRI